MDKKYINSFVKAISQVFLNLGFEEISSGSICVKDSFTCGYNLTIIIGLSGDIKGNVAISMSYETARKIVSIMMLGMEVSEIDEISVSALGEMTNMVCGQAVNILSSSNLFIKITPPTIIHGEKIKAIISQIETSVVAINSSLGTFELNLGFEI